MRNLFPLAPTFLDMAGRAAAFLSGGDDMAPLARTFLECGAGVSVFDPAPGPHFAALSPSVRVIGRRWRAGDFKGVALVIAGPGEPRFNAARASAKAARAIFYMPGAPELSDIAFGASATHERYAIGVSAPAVPVAVQQALLARLQAAAPSGIADYLTAAARSAATIARTLPDEAMQARFWADTTAAAFKTAPADWHAWIQARASAFSNETFNKAKRPRRPKDQ